MEKICKKVNEEIARGQIGPNTSCPYHPAHFRGQDCSFCYCPFFPCGDETFGSSLETSHGPVWNCSDCLFIHRPEVVGFIFSEIERLGISDASDPRFRDIFNDAKERFWKKGRCLMVVGATSDAGKSVTVTALCRMLHRRGYLVAPFKSQNMSLNSSVNIFGSEIAAAQCLQARAAGLTNADFHMNPILIKPKGDCRSQVIVCGRPYRDYDTGSYYSEFIRGPAQDIVEEQIGFLKDRYDYIIMEGAGSPAEINMYDADIANMRAAEIADADVILVVNTEWGGSFAYAKGTLDLIPEKDRARIRGIILNNIRGDSVLMESGIKQLEKMTGIPVIGLIPHTEVLLPNEDSESLRGVRSRGDGKAVIAVIRFPRIANFTDLDPLYLEDITIVFAECPGDLHGADAVIIPGTKNTVSDLEWMKGNGIFDALIRMKGRVPILGLCGGYQMMGSRIGDPQGLEGGTPGTYEGLGFFADTTVFDTYDKITRRNSGIMLCGDGSPVTGYEIHSGRTEVMEEPLFRMERPFSEPEKEGSFIEGEMLFGTYQHGILDRPGFRRYFLSFVIHDGESMTGCGSRDIDDVYEESIDRLADAFEDNIDMDVFRKVLGEEQ